jgi:hypothetical protein
MLGAVLARGGTAGGIGAGIVAWQADSISAAVAAERGSRVMKAPGTRERIEWLARAEPVIAAVE